MITIKLIIYDNYLVKHILIFKALINVIIVFYKSINMNKRT